MILLETAITKSGWRHTITEVVCGKAPGVDTLGEVWGISNNIHVESFPAKWRVYGKKRAGKVRNLEMAAYADALIAVWDGSSPGTRHMIEAATAHRLLVSVLISQRTKV